MPYSIRIEGLDRAQALLGVRIEPALQTASLTIAKEIEAVILPYPPVSEANDPANDRWYQRNWGSRWRRKDGSIGGSKTSQILNSRWGIKRLGRAGASLGNTATYAAWVQSKEKQTSFHKRRGWKTDEAATLAVIQSGAVRRIVAQALVFAMRRQG